MLALSVLPQWKEDWKRCDDGISLKCCFSLNEKRIERSPFCRGTRMSEPSASMKRGLKVEESLIGIISHTPASMKRGLKVTSSSGPETRYIGAPQWKEDWKSFFLLHSCRKVLSLNEKRIESVFRKGKELVKQVKPQWKEDWKWYYIVSRLIYFLIYASMKRGLKGAYFIAFGSVRLRLNEKRIERHKHILLLHPRQLRPQWKEDWKCICPCVLCFMAR